MKHVFLAICIMTLMNIAQAWAGSEDKPDSAVPRDSELTPKMRTEIIEKRTRLTKRAENGNLYAIVDLAASMEQIDSVYPIDRVGAYNLYQKAADRGDRLGRQKMCLAYLLGEGRNKSIIAAMPYCNALGIKDPVGMFALGYDYQYGLSGPKDEKMATGLFLQAAELGSAEANDALGIKALDMGKQQAARTWFKSGTYLGSADAMYHLAEMTAVGEGGVKNEIEAHWLYINAAERGNERAAERLKSLPNVKELQIISLTSPKAKSIQITHTYSDARGTHDEVINLNLISKLLEDNFPQDARGNLVDGHTLINCYVGNDHVLDICIVRREVPLGFALGATVRTFFHGRVVVADKDANGASTADKILALEVHFVLAGSGGMN